MPNKLTPSMRRQLEAIHAFNGCSVRATSLVTHFGSVEALKRRKLVKGPEAIWYYELTDAGREALKEKP